MSEHLITVVSLTYAYKARDVLRRRFPNCKIVPTPKSISRCGCSYSLKVFGDLEEIMELLKQAEITVLS